MSIFAEVQRVTGANRADIVRVATHGGTTAHDREIAEAIEAAGGRKATDLMVQPWRAEHNRLHRALWEETREEDIDFLQEHAAHAGINDIEPLLPGVIETREEAPAPTNPNAVHDPQVRIYDEPTAPDAPPTVLPDHSHENDDEPVDEIDDQVEQTDPGRAAWTTMLHTHVWADVAALTGGDPGEIDRTVRSWTTATQAHDGIKSILIRHASARIRAQLIIDTLYAQAA